MSLSNSFQWDDRLSLGIDLLDKDHKRLFSIIQKILVLSEEEQTDKIKHAAKEGLKFFFTYTIEHFDREEVFMINNSYPDYKAHKQMHDDMKNNVLPALQKDLEDNDYHIDSIRHFLGVCVGWLSTHIMMVDQAILHHDKYKRFDLNFSSADDKLNAVMKKIIHDLYQMDIELISNVYTGWDFGNVLFYELTFQTESKDVIHLLLTIEQKAVFTLASERVGMKINKINSYLLALIKEILSGIATQMAYYLKLNGKYTQRSGVMLQSSEVETIFLNKTLTYSALFSSPIGKFAFSIYQR